MGYASGALIASIVLASALVSAPASEPSGAGAFLLEEAARAAKRGDRAEVDRALRGWASLGPAPGMLPKGLEEPAADALLWAEREGRLRLFASRLEDRVRVGVRDPAALVGRIDAFAVVGGERIRISRTDEDTGDRFEYRIGAPEAIVEVEAVMMRYGRERVVARVELVPSTQSELPKAPERGAFTEPPSDPSEDAALRDRSLEWWMIAGGVLAVALAGAAIWQETRF